MLTRADGSPLSAFFIWKLRPNSSFLRTVLHTLETIGKMNLTGRSEYALTI